MVDRDALGLRHRSNALDGFIQGLAISAILDLSYAAHRGSAGIVRIIGEIRSIAPIGWVGTFLMEGVGQASQKSRRGNGRSCQGQGAFLSCESCPGRRFMYEHFHLSCENGHWVSKQKVARLQQPGLQDCRAPSGAAGSNLGRRDLPPFCRLCVSGPVIWSVAELNMT